MVQSAAMKCQVMLGKAMIKVGEKAMKATKLRRRLQWYEGR